MISVTLSLESMPTEAKSSTVCLISWTHEAGPSGPQFPALKSGTFGTDHRSEGDDWVKPCLKQLSAVPGHDSPWVMVALGVL
jgi:hypothetical protein